MRFDNSGRFLVTIRSLDGTQEEMVYLDPKEFKTGSKGWFTNSKVQLNGQKVQLNINATIVGSKPTS